MSFSGTPWYKDFAEFVINGVTLVDCRKTLDAVGSATKYLYPKAFIVVTEWSDGSDFLKLTSPGDGTEVSLTNAGSKAFQADRQYDISVAQFRSSAANETGFRIICLY